MHLTTPAISMVSGRRSSPWNTYKIVCVLWLLIIATTFPKYLEILTDPAPSTTYAYYFEKIKHPFSVIKSVNEKDHASKLAFRLTVPLLAKGFGIAADGPGKDIVWLYIFQSLLLYPFLVMLAELVFRFTDELQGWIFVFACSFTYLCKAFFWDYDFWFDGYAYFFMLAGLYCRNPYLVFVMLNLACWTDERAVIALPGILLFHLLQEAGFEIPKKLGDIFKDIRSLRPIATLAAGIVYIVIRLFVSGYLSLSTPYGQEAGVSLVLIPYQLAHRLIGVFLTFEGLWIMVCFTIYFLIKAKKTIAFVIIFLLLSQIIVAYSVFDITRSLTYSFPLIIVCFVIFTKYNFGENINSLTIASALCLFTPTQFLIFFPRQIPMTLFSCHELLSILRSTF
jgi:hypothetical protein